MASRLIPARAGKTVIGCGVAACLGAHPRSRGENARWGAIQAKTIGSSPLARGKQRYSLYRQIQAGLIPARAGKTCPGSKSRRGGWAHPRSRGENTS